MQAINLLAGTAVRLLTKLLTALSMIVAVAGLFFPGLLPFVDMLGRVLPGSGSLFD